MKARLFNAFWDSKGAREGGGFLSSSFFLVMGGGGWVGGDVST